MGNMFQTEESQQLIVHALSSNTPPQTGVKQALSRVSSAPKRVARNGLLLFLGFTQWVSRYSGVAMRDDELHVEEISGET